jgi:hypothetical protein
MPYFDHEKLDVYQAAMEFVVLVDETLRTCLEGGPI